MFPTNESAQRLRSAHDGGMATFAELFDLWREADGLAVDAERILSQALIECAKGGPAPEQLQLEVARALRHTASQRLAAAIAAYHDRPP